MKLIDDEIAKYERQAREAHADADQTRDGFRRDFARQCEAKTRQWRELRDSLPVGVPDGYALVPVEPTFEMRDAGNVYTLNRSTLFAIWRAMLDAAPTVNAEQVQAPSLPAAGSELTASQCACGDEYPANSYGAGFMAANNGICENCDAANSCAIEPMPAAGSSYGIALPSVAEFGEWIGPDGNGPDSATRGMLLALFKWTLDRVCALNASRAALSAQQSAPERVSVPRDLLADLISSDHDTKIQAERALYALLASHAEGGKV